MYLLNKFLKSNISPNTYKWSESSSSRLIVQNIIPKTQQEITEVLHRKTPTLQYEIIQWEITKHIRERIFATKNFLTWLDQDPLYQEWWPLAKDKQKERYRELSTLRIRLLKFWVLKPWVSPEQLEEFVRKYH